MRKSKTKKTEAGEEGKEEYYCSICGREISKEDYEDYDGMCWDDQMTEECEFEEGII